MMMMKITVWIKWRWWWQSNQNYRNMRVSLSFKKRFYFLFKTNWHFQAVGYYWIVNRLWTFSNPRLLSNIRDANQTLTLYCNTGKAIVTKKRELKGYGTIWHHRDGITNILSLSNAQKKYKVTTNQCYMWSLKRPYMGHCKHHCCFGGYYPTHWKNGGSN